MCGFSNGLPLERCRSLSTVLSFAYLLGRPRPVILISIFFDSTAEMGSATRDRKLAPRIFTLVSLCAFLISSSSCSPPEAVEHIPSWHSLSIRTANALTSPAQPKTPHCKFTNHQSGGLEFVVKLLRPRQYCEGNMWADFINKYMDIASKGLARAETTISWDEPTSVCTGKFVVAGDDSFFRDALNCWCRPSERPIRCVSFALRYCPLDEPAALREI